MFFFGQWNRSCTLSVGIFDIDVKLLDSYIEDDGVMVIANITIKTLVGAWNIYFNFYLIIISMRRGV